MIIRLQRARDQVKRFASYSESWQRTMNRSLHSTIFPSDSAREYSFTPTDRRGLLRVLEACRHSMDIRNATKTHSKIVVLGYGAYPSILASLISTYARCHRLGIAYRVLDWIFTSAGDLFTVNLIIESLMKNGHCDIAKKGDA
ncbi:hypothetical protein L6164_014934 [Bauhinia variegata]|uniref:Uncharacterized protein n=1 Tax=Bauhinia variegata TaxID=167791 RepID=A0ACB9NIR1_BAUVA|nr:hypothetical protein L6164_014934 [Bauhinia variegata]